MTVTPDHAGVSVARRLAERRGEIEREALAGVLRIADPPSSADDDYLRGLREAVSVAVGFGIEVLEHGDDRAPEPSTALLSQARLAARNGISLDVVLRRYLSGYALFTQYVSQEDSALPPSDRVSFRATLRAAADSFDRLVEAVAKEYKREISLAKASGGESQARLVERLLAGDLVDISKLAYNLDAWHVGMVLADTGGLKERLRALAEATDCRLLAVQRDDETIWAWLGRRRRRLESREVLDRARDFLAGGAAALGEPATNLAGWQLSHRQARAIFPLAQREDEIIRYADVGLIMGIAGDGLLTESLRQLYVAPLSVGRDGGYALRETVRAYLSNGQSITSAAATLKLNRQTVRNRLRVAEEQIGRPLGGCAAEMAIALRLDQTLQPQSTDGTVSHERTVNMAIRIPHFGDSLPALPVSGSPERNP